MKTLAFDTSTRFLSIACLENGELKGSVHKDAGIIHSEILVPEIKGVLRDAGWSLNEVDLLSAGLGPGSFTGLRIGVATLKGLAAVTGKNVKCVPSMDAIAAQMHKEIAGEGPIAPVLDARKGKVYTCIYDRASGGPVPVTGYMLVEMEKFLGGLDREVTFAGDALGVYGELLVRCRRAKISGMTDWYPRASDIARMATDLALAGTDDPAEIDPIYIYPKECNITGPSGG